MNYSTFDRELLVAAQAIKHFLPQVEGRVFQLWTDHKPLVAAMKRVTPPISGRQNTRVMCGTHLAWTTWWRTP
jgi:hypothetical protein